MEATVIVTVLALAQFMLFGIQVGSMRGKHGVKAPATTGHPEFDGCSRTPWSSWLPLFRLCGFTGIW